MAEPVDDGTWLLATTDGTGVEQTVTPVIVTPVTLTPVTVTPMTNGTAMSVSPTLSSDGVFQSIDRYVTPVWYVLGIPGNLLAYCVWMQPKMRRSSGVYLASLALVECLFLIMQVNQIPYRVFFIIITCIDYIDLYFTSSSSSSTRVAVGQHTRPQVDAIVFSGLRLTH